MQKKLILSVLITSLLTACGGSSDNSNPQVTPQATANSQQAQRLTTFTLHDVGDFWDTIKTQGYATHNLSVGNKTLASSARGQTTIQLDLTAVPEGFSAPLPARVSYTGGSRAAHNADVTLRSYRGFYAGAFIYDKEDFDNALDYDYQVYGKPTQANELPTRGNATYTGRAFNIHPADDRAFTYRIDFANKRGSGSVAAQGNHPELILKEAALAYEDSPFGAAFAVSWDNGKVAAADNSIIGQYELFVAGPGAEEVAGALSYTPAANASETDLIFYGKRGDITP